MNSPEFQKALKEACENQWLNWFYGGELKTVPRQDVEESLKDLQWVKEKAQRSVEEAKRRAGDVKSRVEKRQSEIKETAEELRRLNNPILRRAMENLKVSKVDLVCPICGEGDKGNRMNGKPWCSMCKVQLIKYKVAEKWVNVKVMGKGLDDDTLRKIRGLPDDGGITRGRVRKRRKRRK
jgi:hypothetical protein